MSSDVTAIVQRGRSVSVGPGVVVVGRGDKATTLAAEPQIAMPGDRITLPAKDMQPLLDHGFVKLEVNPQLPEAMVGGPKVLQEGVNAPKVAIVADAPPAEPAE